MCKWGTYAPVNVIHRNNDDYKDGWHQIYVDSCIAPLIQQMNNQGIITVGCCCGHGKDVGWVQIDSISEPLLAQHGYRYRLEHVEYKDAIGGSYTLPWLIHDLPKVILT